MSLDFTKTHERFAPAHHGRPTLFLRVATLRARFTCPSVTCDLRHLAGDVRDDGSMPPQLARRRVRQKYVRRSAPHPARASPHDRRTAACDAIAQLRAPVRYVISQVWPEPATTLFDSCVNLLRGSSLLTGVKLLIALC